jgi:muramoyltetrapeptide carboxypeptidase
MLTPRALRPGDRIAVVSPASPFDRATFDQGLGEIRALGFEPVYDESVFARRAYVSGAPELRADAIRRAWRDDRVAALIAVRGGYGSAQLLPLLDPEEARRAAKPFIGYSDMTALLMFLTLRCGVVSFHGPMLDRRLSAGADGYDRETFCRALSTASPMGALTAPGLVTLRRGEASGMLLGGTMALLLASLGTPFAFDPPAGYVLFLDEVGERPYRLDRQLTQFRQAGLLDRASAIVVGELPRCDEPSGITGRQVMADLLSSFHGPVLFGFPSGHTVGPTMTLPFGVRCRVVAGDEPSLIIEEAAVR